MTGFTYNDIIWELDPLMVMRKEGGALPGGFNSMLGLIPTFIYNTDDVVQEALNAYGYGAFEMTGIVDEQGVYRFPEDPPLYPLAQCIAGDKIVRIYAYGIVSFVGVFDAKTQVYRFD